MSQFPFSRPRRYLTEATQADLYREGRSGNHPVRPNVFSSTSTSALTGTTTGWAVDNLMEELKVYNLQNGAAGMRSSGDPQYYAGVRREAV
jgi:hypothetical protein